MIDSETGILKVKEHEESQQMDRDNGTTEHFIRVNVDDNDGAGLLNRESITIRLVLMDCNDNAPEMPPELLISSIREDFLQNLVINPNFYAPDIDEGKNAEVDYAIDKIEIGNTFLIFLRRF